jgi:Fic family protein
MSNQSQRLQAYTEPHQFEPLIPRKQVHELGMRSRSVVEASLRLQGALHPGTRESLRDLVRSMNSYYSNRIEGQSTHPVNIERALRADFSDRPDIARRQRLALAHIDAEKELERQCAGERHALSSAFLVRAHSSLYGRLPAEDRQAEQGQTVEPGALRQQDVAVYRHQAPTWQSVPAFLARADEVYARDWSLDDVLVAVACAHHRGAWVHPFVDGNGRTVRLQTHCALFALSSGLWSVNRGLARNREAYYMHLSNADMPRHGDLDGRGNLSERMLVKWCEFFIETCEDQVSFMSRMLNLGDFRKRLEALVLVRSATHGVSEYRSEIVIALHHVFAAGPVSRGDFIQLTGLAERTGRRVLSRLIADGLLVSDSPKGEVRLGLPIDALGVLFPNLYVEASTDPGLE